MMNPGIAPRRFIGTRNLQDAIQHYHSSPLNIECARTHTWRGAREESWLRQPVRGWPSRVLSLCDWGWRGGRLSPGRWARRGRRRLDVSWIRSAGAHTRIEGMEEDSPMTMVRARSSLELRSDMFGLQIQTKRRGYRSEWEARTRSGDEERKKERGVRQPCSAFLSFIWQHPQEWKSGHFDHHEWGCCGR